MKNLKNYLDKNIFFLLGKYIWPLHIKTRFFVCFSIFFLLASKISTVTVPFILKNIVDNLSCNTTSVSMTPFILVLSYGIARLFAQTFSDFKDILFSWVNQRAFRLISLDIFKALHDLSLRYHLDRKTGGISRSIERGVKSVETFLGHSVFFIIPSFIEICLVSCILYILYEWYYTIITIFMFVLYTLFTFSITQKRLHIIRNLNKEDTMSNAVSTDSLLNYETVKYFTNEELENDRYDACLTKYQKTALKSKISFGIMNVGQNLIIATGLMVITSLFVWDIQNGSKTVGDFILLNTYLLQIYIPLGQLGFAYKEIKLSLVNMESMFAILKEKKEILDCPDARPLEIKKGEVVFENVSFSYSLDNSILENISFKVPSGQTVAIVGASGAGKSTISRLLFRFYDVTKGRILIDGQDIRKVTQISLRNAIGIVPQDTVLFNETLYYNLSYSNPHQTKEKVYKAVQLAHLNNFVEQLPLGYETQVGERGIKLSGGEKQRVAIARIILKNPYIYLFDEATSALDTETEKEIQKNIQEISKNRTTLIIAHRLSTIIHANQILVLDHGNIIEKGTHEILLQKKGIYAQMWKRQHSEKVVVGHN